jgi:hypothetical protein
MDATQREPSETARFLKGFRRIDLPDSTMHWLGGAALVEVGPMAWYLIKHIFS